ncbi:MAG: T9SS type A sorting domain-containing protein [Candidatus Cloacimonetes bacterium]|nr:T9SS type A sorting domain-containing protein [Candidatus Cloacimonadota bacterium]
MNKLITIIFALVLITGLFAEIGDLLWEENFDSLDNWIIETGNGSWGWGNAELEYYSPNNVDIAEIPGEAGNNALRITARNESGANIVDQWGNPLNYTSGRLNTKSKVSIQYGVIEARVLIPDINLGGWPAVWLLGTSTLGWPRCGEMDMMEMGGKQSYRNLHDSHNGGNNQDNSTVNQSVSANAIYYSEDSINPDNPSGAASISWDPNDESCRPYYSYNPPLTGRFLTYRAYWDDTSLRFTVIDNNVEYDLYEEALYFDESSTEFQSPFYLVTNLAIGGLFTDALGLDGSGAPVSMPLPAEMYVDYIKVNEWNDMGEVHVGPPEFQYETFGIFTDNTTTYNSLEVGVDAEIYVWEGTLSQGSIAPYEGDNGITWTTNGVGWFGAGVMSMQPTNLFNFGDGYLKFHINIPAHISFQIGIIDAWGNQSYVQFPAHQTTYGLVRNGQWGQASIPVDDLRGDFIDLRMLSYEFVILEVSGAQCEFGIDNIYWDGGTVSNDEETVEISNFELSQNYPNPFNPSTTISYSLIENSFVEIEIYNLKGQKINTLLSENRTKGNHSVEWDGTDLSKHPVSSGVYFYKLKVNNQSSMKKMILLK